MVQSTITAKAKKILKVLGIAELPPPKPAPQPAAELSMPDVPGSLGNGDQAGGFLFGDSGDKKKKDKEGKKDAKKEKDDKKENGDKN